MGTDLFSTIVGKLNVCRRSKINILNSVIHKHRLSIGLWNKNISRHYDQNIKYKGSILMQIDLSGCFFFNNHSTHFTSR